MLKIIRFVSEYIYKYSKCPCLIHFDKRFYAVSDGRLRTAIFTPILAWRFVRNLYFIGVAICALRCDPPPVRSHKIYRSPWCLSTLCIIHVFLNIRAWDMLVCSHRYFFWNVAIAIFRTPVKFYGWPLNRFCHDLLRVRTRILNKDRFSIPTLILATRS